MRGVEYTLNDGRVRKWLVSSWACEHGKTPSKCRKCHPPPVAMSDAQVAGGCTALTLRDWQYATTDLAV